MKHTIKKLLKEYVMLLKEAVCPECGSLNAYMGLNAVECDNPRCSHYSRRQYEDVHGSESDKDKSRKIAAKWLRDITTARDASGYNLRDNWDDPDLDDDDDNWVGRDLILVQGEDIAVDQSVVDYVSAHGTPEEKYIVAKSNVTKKQVEQLINSDGRMLGDLWAGSLRGAAENKRFVKDYALEALKKSGGNSRAWQQIATTAVYADKKLYYDILDLARKAGDDDIVSSVEEVETYN